ncbi:MAG: hypothetical protein KUL83_06570 [Lentimicrobium sp.]|nr:hypothetical protein [Lentimicrobium sp.]MDY0026986.1 hypothetical protein [Lentimicrobium sp.]
MCIILSLHQSYYPEQVIKFLIQNSYDTAKTKLTTGKTLANFEISAWFHQGKKNATAPASHPLRQAITPLAGSSS